MARRFIVVCPVCGKSKLRPIPKEIFDIEEGALLKLPFEEGVICEHAFVAEIDYRFAIRGYETPNERNNYLLEYFENGKKKKDLANFSYF